MVSEWDIIISGFTQTLQTRTGSEQLWERMRPLASPERCIQILPWRSDWDAFAAFVFRVSVPRPVIRINAFSWGVGWGFMRFCYALGIRGLRVQKAVWCDGVYRSPWLPPWLPANLLSVTPWPWLTVPSVVDELHWLYQRQTLPMGHRPVKPKGSPTVVHSGIELDCAHVYADRSPLYHDLALRVAGA